MTAKPKINVENSKFDFDLGIKILKAKHGTLEAFEKTAYISEKAMKLVREEWPKAGKVTVMEALGITNLESRRVCFRYIGIDTIFAELKPELADKRTIKKATRVNKDGELEVFDDTYELYLVKGETLTQNIGSENLWRRVQDFYILRCSCTSTGREYLIYIQDIWNKARKPDAIEAVAWTIQVDVEAKDVIKIVRAGDCIMVRPKAGYKKCTRRHISKDEYLDKVVMES